LLHLMLATARDVYAQLHVILHTAFLIGCLSPL
jgi:hypothetical protein